MTKKVTEASEKVTESVPKTKKSDRTPFAALLLRHPEKISIENEIFERATHRGPFFCGGKSRHRDYNFRAGSNISIEIENFDRDQIFLIVGPSGQYSGRHREGRREGVELLKDLSGPPQGSSEPSPPS